MNVGSLRPGPRPSLTLRRSVAATDGVHYQVALRHLGHHFYGFGQRFVVYSKMLHGIQVKAYSNAAIVHHRDQVGDQLLCL